MFDAIIVGGGPGGYTAALRLAGYGKTVALVERELIGGTCLNRGCIPTKTLLHSATLLGQLRAASALGITVQGAAVDYDTLRTRKETVTQQLRTGILAQLKAKGVTLLRGEAHVEGAGRVSVTTPEGMQTLEGAAVVVAAGSRPLLPPIPGIHLPGVVTSDELLEQVPQLARLTIIGGGVIGMEFAALYHGLGTQVTVLEAQPRILPTMDRELSQSLSAHIKGKGVALVTGAMVEGIEGDGDSLRCRYTVKGETFTVESDRVLLAVGRTANTDGLFSPGYTPAMERGRVVVDGCGQTSLPGLYALGDAAAGGLQLAHAAFAQAEVLAAHLAGVPCGLDPNLVPACVYTEPEVATVGLTEGEAKAAGVTVKCGKALLSANGRNLAGDGERGYIKLVCTPDGVVKGAQLFCPRATDLVGELALAVAKGLTAAELNQVVRPHPTFEEAVGEAAQAVLARLEAAGETK